MKSVQIQSYFWSVFSCIWMEYGDFPLRSIGYNLRYKQTGFSVSSVNTTHFSLNSLRYFGSNVWNIVPLELKDLNNVEMFNSYIRKWESRQYECT